MPAGPLRPLCKRDIWMRMDAGFCRPLSLSRKLRPRIGRAVCAFCGPVPRCSGRHFKNETGLLKARHLRQGGPRTLPPCYEDGRGPRIWLNEPKVMSSIPGTNLKRWKEGKRKGEETLVRKAVSRIYSMLQLMWEPSIHICLLLFKNIYDYIFKTTKIRPYSKIVISIRKERDRN